MQHNTISHPAKPEKYLMMIIMCTVKPCFLEPLLTFTFPGKQIQLMLALDMSWFYQHFVSDLTVICWKLWWFDDGDVDDYECEFCLSFARAVDVWWAAPVVCYAIKCNKHQQAYYISVKEALAKMLAMKHLEIYIDHITIEN